MDYIEKRINRLLTETESFEMQLGSFEHQLILMEKNNAHEDAILLMQDGVSMLKSSLDFSTRSLYQSVVTYLDEKNLPHCISMCYKIFGDDPFSLKGIDETYTDPESFESKNVFLQNMNIFLSSFEFTESFWEKRERTAGLKYLYRILCRTNLITLKLSTPPKSEADVYKSVKDTMTVIFNDIDFPTSNFFKGFKEYKPDILIPELSAAVEYKYARDEEKLKSTIEQIAIDVKGYTGNANYNMFYAVFYVTTDFWGIEKFNSVWSGFDFPPNWIPVYVVGK